MATLSKGSITRGAGLGPRSSAACCPPQKWGRRSPRKLASKPAAKRPTRSEAPIISAGIRVNASKRLVWHPVHGPPLCAHWPRNPPLCHPVHRQGHGDARFGTPCAGLCGAHSQCFISEREPDAPNRGRSHQWPRESHRDNHRTACGRDLRLTCGRFLRRPRKAYCTPNSSPTLSARRIVQPIAGREKMGRISDRR